MLEIGMACLGLSLFGIGLVLWDIARDVEALLAEQRKLLIILQKILSRS